jgi:hypothetical protein
MFSSSISTTSINVLLKWVDPTREDIIKDLKDGKFSLVFRKACNEKLYPLISAMLDIREELAIDLNQPSSNGNTALDWLDKNLTPPFSTIHQEIRDKLCDKGALNGKKEVKEAKELIDFNKDAALFLGVDELAISFPNSDYPIIGTFGAGQCMILGIYDSQNYKALVSHISGLDKNSIKQLNTLKQELNSFSSASSVAYILGGQNNATSKLTYKYIIDLLKTKKIPIKFENVFKSTSADNSASFAINAVNGRAYFSVNAGNFEYSIERVMASTEVPLGEISIVENINPKRRKQPKK